MRSFKKIIVKILLLTILLENKTIASEIEARKINAGEEAPWGGIIMPPEQFQFIDSELAACKYIADHPQPCPADSDFKDSITIGIFGFSLGAIAMLFVKPK